MEDTTQKKEIALTSYPEGYEKACEMLDFLPDDPELRKAMMKNILMMMYSI